TKKRQRQFDGVGYDAKTLGKKRTGIAKSDRNEPGANTRFVVTNASSQFPWQMYDDCAPGGEKV
ncbi:MAG: hypothetical protein ACE5FU_10745, partial [Nitrospinota bacterium]